MLFPVRSKARMVASRFFTLDSPVPHTPRLSQPFMIEFIAPLEDFLPFEPISDASHMADARIIS